MQPTRTPLVIAVAFGLLAVAWFAAYVVPGKALLAVHPGMFRPFEQSVSPELLAELEGRSKLYSDKLLQHHPEVLFSVDAVRSFELPTWNPDVLGGVPHLATGLPSAFYPPMWLSLCIDPPYCYAWIAMLQMAIGGFLFFLMLREFSVAPVASAVGGMLFCASAWMSVHQEYFQLTAPATWFPLAILGARRMARGRGGVFAVATAVALSFLSGFPQIACYNLLAAGLCLVFCLATRSRSGREASVDPAAPPARVSAPWRTALRFAGACALGLGVAAPQLFTTAELASSSRSTREVLTGEQLVERAVQPAWLSTAVFPDLLDHPDFVRSVSGPKLHLFGALYGSSLDPTSTASYAENNFYLGPAALLLALFGVCCGRRGARGFFSVLTILAIALMLPGPLLGWSAYIPGLNIGDPKRYLFVVTCGLAALAALGIDRLWPERSGAVAMGELSGRPSPQIFFYAAGLVGVALLATAMLLQLGGPDWTESFLVPRLAGKFEVGPDEVRALIPASDFELHHRLAIRELGLAGGFVLLAGAALLGVVRCKQTWPRALATGALFVALGLPLAWVWARATHPVPTAEMTTRPPLVEEILQSKRERAGRIARIKGADTDLFPVFPPKLPMLYGIRDVQGYVAVYLKVWRDLFETLEPGSTLTIGPLPLRNPEHLALPLFDALDVEYAFGPWAMDQPVPKLAGWSRVASLGTQEAEPGVVLWRNDERFGRVRLVGSFRGLDSEQQLLEELCSVRYRPDREALATVDQCALWSIPADWQRAPNGTGSRWSHADGAPGSCVIEQDGNSEILVQVQGEGGMLVLADAYYPGWRVQVDGEERELLQVDHAFRGVFVPAGDHQVRFWYRPLSLELGFLVGAVSLAAGLWLRLRPGRKDPIQEPAA